MKLAKLTVVLISVFSNLVLLSAAQAEHVTFDIPKLDAIIVDGNSSDWDGRGFRVEILAGADGHILPPDDLDANFRLGWNQQGLLILVTVRDDIVAEYRKVSELYRKDSIELFMSENIGSTNRYQVLVASGADEKYGRLRSHFNDYRSGKENLPELTGDLGTATTQDGYVVEALLPWKNLGIDAKLGTEVGFQLDVNDSDISGEGGGDRVDMLWYPRPNAHEDATAMYLLRLADKPSNAMIAWASNKLEPSRGRAAIIVHGTAELVGESVSVQDGEMVLEVGKFSELAGRATAEISVDLRPVGQVWQQPHVVVGGESVLPLDFSNVHSARIRELLDQRMVFKPYGFTGEKFPTADFEHPLQVENLIGPYTIHIRYYDKDFRSVNSADKQGRYGAVIEITPDNGRMFRRFRTLVRLSTPMPGWDAPLSTVPWASADFKTSIELRDQLGVTLDATTRQSKAISDFTKWSLDRSFRNNAEATVLLAGLYETGTDASNDVWAMDRQWWVTLKRKLYGSEEHLPDSFVCPRPVKAQKAPVVREGTLAEAGMTVDAVQKIDEVCQKWAADSDEGFAVCIVRHGVIALHKAYGMRDGKLMTVGDKSWMASITKLLSGTLMMMLVDQGLVGLDHRVDKYLPVFRDIEVEKPLTIRRLYVHTNGLWGHWGDELSDFEERIASYYPYLEVARRHAYNGAGYALGGKIIEMVSGEAIPQFYRSHLLQPLGCENTDVVGTSFDARSVPLDIARIGQMLLNQGAYGDHRFFSEETFQKMLPTPMEKLAGGGGPKSWGIGNTWMMGKLSDKTFGHGAASAATFVIDPAHELVVVMTRNRAGKNFSKYHPKFVDAIVAGINETENVRKPSSSP